MCTRRDGFIFGHAGNWKGRPGDHRGNSGHRAKLRKAETQSTSATCCFCWMQLHTLMSKILFATNTCHGGMDQRLLIVVIEFCIWIRVDLTEQHVSGLCASERLTLEPLDAVHVEPVFCKMINCRNIVR
jgi:hypothetical protein